MSVAQGGSGYFSISDVLTRAWTVLSANFLFFIGVTLIAYAVIFVVVMVVVLIALAAGQFGGRDTGVVLAAIMGLAAFVFVMCVLMASQATMLFGAFQYLRGLPVRLGESLQRAFGRILPLIGIGLLWLLIMLCAGLLLFGLANLSMVAAGIVGVLLIVPALILVCMWFVSVQVCVVEGLGPVASLSRSAALTKGYRWHLLGIAAIIFVGRLVITQVVQLGLTPVSATLAATAGVIVSTLLGLYGFCAVIMAYHDLRVAKEGVDTTQIASVFD